MIISALSNVAQPILGLSNVAQPISALSNVALSNIVNDSHSYSDLHSYSKR